MGSQSRNRRSGLGQSDLGLSMAEAAMAGQPGGPQTGRGPMGSLPPMGGMPAGIPQNTPSGIPNGGRPTGALPPGLANMESLPRGLANMESLPPGLANFGSRVPSLPSGLGYNEARGQMGNQFGEALEFLRGQREAARTPPPGATADSQWMPPAGSDPKDLEFSRRRRDIIAELERLGLLNGGFGGGPFGAGSQR